MGDVKVALLLGAAFGAAVAVALVVAVVAGAVVAVAVIAKRGRGTTLAFGPFLALGAAVAVFWGNALSKRLPVDVLNRRRHPAGATPREVACDPPLAVDPPEVMMAPRKRTQIRTLASASGGRAGLSGGNYEWLSRTNRSADDTGSAISQTGSSVKTHDGYLSSCKEVSRVNRIYNFLFSLRREEGQTMAEYGVVLAVITVALVTLFAALSTGIGNEITKVAVNVLKSVLKERALSSRGLARWRLSPLDRYPTMSTQNSTL